MQMHAQHSDLHLRESGCRDSNPGPAVTAIAPRPRDVEADADIGFRHAGLLHVCGAPVHVEEVDAPAIIARAEVPAVPAGQRARRRVA